MIFRKKLPCVILLFAAGMTGCIKEREVETPEGKERPVVFAPQVSRGGESRAATGHPIENGATIPVDYHFGVYAWVKPTSVAPVEPFAELHNTKVRHASAAEYTYDPVASWPRDAEAKLACMAYYPWSDQTGNIRVTTGTGTNQTMTINYTVPASSDDHVDLMYARTGQTAGYDPVNLDFHHALARLKFEGRTEDFPAGSAVKITGIRITNAVMKGDLEVLDPATQPGKPWWELSTVPADKGTITMPAAHIKDLALTARLQSVITPGGDMLVIPQTVDGLTVEVSASLNGTTFPEPFVFSLTSSPEWTMNEIITYEITLMPDGMHLSANVTDWTTDPVSVIHDGQWWLSVNEDTFEFDVDGGSATLTAETNYNRIDLGYPAGLQIDATEIVYEPAVTSGNEWLTLTDRNGGLNGDLVREIIIEATPHTVIGIRTAKMKITAGNLTKIINFIQENPGIAPRFARSNIVWTGSKLTFAVTRDDNAVIPSDVQGVFFKWGSLMPISPVGAFNGSTSVLFIPPNYSGITPSGTGSTGWSSVPWMDNTTPPFDDDDNSSDDFATYNGSTGYDESSAKGDICRYISARKWVEGKWRIPTQTEYNRLSGEASIIVNGESAVITIPSGNNIYGGYESGYYNGLCGKWIGFNIFPEDSPVAPAKGIYLPLCGRRSGASGNAVFANFFGYYWTTASGSYVDGYLTSFQGNHLGLGFSTMSRTDAAPIRCIRVDE